ncbi:MAG TPA: 5'-deoxyadenosine deaminase [Vicinamibacterales bacterium]|nr:5'-deoxyadenosine deaminase [Vicinamibacterales bacterium]
MAALIRHGTILTMNAALEVVSGDVWTDGQRIAGVGTAPPDLRADLVIDAEGAIVLPGFVQTHVHLCQTLFRGLADDLPLLPWLKTRVWPLEAAHDERTLGASARLAAAELLLGGTTTVLTMETVHGTDAVFDALVPTGLRAVVGKCLMNERGDAPARLSQAAREAIDDALDLDRRWSGAAGGRLRAALAPRFALSCSRDLLEAVAAVSAERGLLVHTHASEQREEVEIVRRQTGLDNVAYLASLGLATERLCAAHCVWVTEDEQRLLADRRVKVLHCPGSNLKLGSGLAPVVEMRARGVAVSLGADGAACNNTLDMFHEMRLAATLQAMRYGPGALAARDVVRMATRDGAHALGLDQEIGAIEPGKRADLIVVRADAVHQTPGADPYSALVYASRPSDVVVTMVDGHVVAREGELDWADRRQVVADAARAARSLRARAAV